VRERFAEKSSFLHTRTKILCYICVDCPILSRLICDLGGGTLKTSFLKILVDSRTNVCAKWFFYTIQFSTMSDEPTTGCHANAVRILTGMLPMLDSANPNDRAFKQVR